MTKNEYISIIPAILFLLLFIIGIWTGLGGYTRYKAERNADKFCETVKNCEWLETFLRGKVDIRINNNVYKFDCRGSRCVLEHDEIERFNLENKSIK